MKVTVILDNRMYESLNNPEISAEKASEVFYEKIGGLERLKLSLIDGSYLVLGETALKRCALIFSDKQGVV